MSNVLFRSFALAGATALLLTSAPASAAPKCTTYADLEHCPLGSARLGASGEALQVSGTGPGGSDGVGVILPDSRDWQAGVQFSSGDGTPQVTLGARAGGEVVSSALVTTADDGKIHLSATFTGSDGPATYSVLVYRDGTLVGSEGGANARQYLSIDDWFDVYWDSWHHIGFHNRVVNGACVWTFGFGESLSIVLPNGSKVTGDEIHLVEEVGGGGQYPYVAFDGISLRSSRDLQIVSEEAH